MDRVHRGSIHSRRRRGPGPDALRDSPWPFGRGHLHQRNIRAPRVNHREHFFAAGTDQRSAPHLINQAIIAQLSTYPLGSSSGSMTYAFDAALGSFTRSSESFGPSFAERPLTIGRRQIQLRVQRAALELRHVRREGSRRRRDEVLYAYTTTAARPPIRRGQSWSRPSKETSPRSGWRWT